MVHSPRAKSTGMLEHIYNRALPPFVSTSQEPLPQEYEIPIQTHWISVLIDLITKMFPINVIL